MSVLEINLEKIRQNTANVKKALGDIELAGVTKACAGDIKVCRAIIEGGAEVIADSRIENLGLLKGLPVKKMLLRAPVRGENFDILKHVDFVVASNLGELDKIKKFYHEKPKIGLVLNIETGFKREGFDPAQLGLALERVASMGSSYYLSGFSTNTACQNGGNPLNQLKRFTDIIQPYINFPLPTSHFSFALPTSHFPLIISGGNSSILPWALGNKLPLEINQLRIGEAILLGHETVNYRPVASNNTDVFKVEAEVIQQNKSQGRRQAVLAVGYQDIGAGKLKPLDTGVKKISHMYSEYCKVELADDASLGESARFKPDYYGLVALMASPYVRKKYTFEKGDGS